MQSQSISRRKVVVASSVAIAVAEILDAEAAKSGTTTSSLIRQFIHDGLRSRGVELPEGAGVVTDDDGSDNGSAEGK